MRNKSRSRPKQQPMASINVVPYIDVMLVLLVIFMVVMPKIQQGIEVNLPQASSKEVDISSDLPIVISISKTGGYYLNKGPDQNQTIALNDLIPKVLAVHQLQKQTPILLRADAQVKYENVVQLMALLKKNNISKLGLLTQNPPN